MTHDQVAAAVRVAVHYPLRSRVALAEQVLEKFPNQYDDPAEFLLDRAKLYMAQGKWREAAALLAGTTQDHPSLAEPLALWQSWMVLGGKRTGTYFGPIPDDCPFDVVRAVNRGFTFFANAFYEDALQWLLFGLTKSESDPFAVFGHALCLWEKGMFALAADQLRLAIERIRDRSEPRFLGFMRWDDSCPPRSYTYDPRYLIFNPAECLERVTKRESFVSHILLP